MPRRIIGQQTTDSAAAQRLGSSARARVRTGPGTGQRLRRDRRSERYRNAIRRLDSSLHGGETDREALAAIIDAEFTDFDEFLPVGFVAQCYLGPPFEVHTVNRTGTSVIDHYPVGSTLPDGLERARGLALHPSYDLIEVYGYRMVAVTTDGSVVELDR